MAASERKEPEALQTLQPERLALIGRRTLDIAHDMNNAVGFITNSVGNLKRYVGDLLELLSVYEEMESHLPEHLRARARELRESLRLADVRTDLPKILAALAEGGRRSKATAAAIVAFAQQGGQARREPVDVGERAAQVVARHQLEQEGRVRVTFVAERVPQLHGYAHRLEQMVENLLVNALHATPAGGEVRVSVTGADNGCVTLTVEDSGHGMTEEVRARLFEPFFTQRAQGAPGTGLGMSIVRDVVDAHGGSVDVDSAPGRGTRVRVRLPIAQPPETRDG